MLNLMNLLRHELITRLRGDERGVVYVEYALLITLIGLVIVGGATASRPKHQCCVQLNG